MSWIERSLPRERDGDPPEASGPSQLEAERAALLAQGDAA